MKMFCVQFRGDSFLEKYDANGLREFLKENGIKLRGYDIGMWIMKNPFDEYVGDVFSVIED